MKIALVGGTRFIGHVAAERAIVCGHDVTVIHRGVHLVESLRASRSHRLSQLE